MLLFPHLEDSLYVAFTHNFCHFYLSGTLLQPLLAQKVMSLKLVCSRKMRLLSTLVSAPVFLAQSAVSSNRSGREHRSSGCAFTGRKHRVPPWGSRS